MGAKYTAQSGMGLLGKNENLSSPSGAMLKKSGCRSTGFYSEEMEPMIPGACGPASVAQLMSSSSVGDPASKEMNKVRLLS